MATSYKSLIPVIEALRIQPYSPGSKLANNNPGFEHFTDRSQFIPFKNISHLAVMLEATNPAFGNPRRRHAKKTFFVNILDLEDGTVVSSRSIFIDMDADNPCDRYRADVSLTYSQIDPDKQYAVEVVTADNKDGIPAASMLFRFIGATNILPTRYYTPLEGGIRHINPANDGIETSQYYREATDAIWNEDEVKAVFHLEDHMTATLGFAPELFADVDNDYGSTPFPVELTELYTDGEGRSVRDAIVTIPTRLGEGHLSSMTIRVHLKSLGYTFATLLLNTVAEHDRPGCFTADELVKTELSSPAKWLELATERSKSWDKESRPEPTAMDELNAMVGLDEIKAKVKAYRQLMQFFERRRKAGLATKYPALHSMFLGAPGTGKTTVAKIIGRVLKECGVLSSGHVVVRERGTLIGQYYSSESENTLKALEEAQGGILFIDEAYQLMSPEDPKDPGRWVIDTLMTALSDESKRDWMLILAGYTEPTQRLLELNPGLASRIPATNMYNFKDFSSDELMEIASGYFKAQEFTLTPNAARKLKVKLESDHSNRGKDFGNGRHVVNLIESHILPAMAARLADTDECTPEVLSTIRSSDIPAPEVEVQRSAPARVRMGFVG